PNTMAFCANAQGCFSAKARNKRDGPRVMSRYNSDGGYFVVLRNDKSAYNGVRCSDQGTGSPYALIRRITTNNTRAPMPRAISRRCRRIAGNASVYMAPRQ